MTMFESAKIICSTLQDHGHQAFIVGGACRDLAMNRTPKDYDIVTSALPKEIEEVFPHSFGVGKKFGIINVLLNGIVFEIATFRQDSYGDMDGRHPSGVSFAKSYEEDAKRRDLTMNAIYYNPSTGELLDPVGGKHDIENKIIRFIGNPQERLQEDRLRALRAIRFSSQLGFNIEPESEKALMQVGHEEDPFNHNQEVGISWERIRDELSKILCSQNPVKGILYLKDLGYLSHIIPEYDPMWSCHQSKSWHAEGSAAVHSMLVLANCSTADLPDRLACFLHDIGKPSTLAIQDSEDGSWKYTNRGHDVVGARMTREILERLKFSNAVIKEVEYSVLNHMRAQELPKWKKTWKIRRFLGHKFFPATYRLSLADNAGCITKNPKGFLKPFVEEWKNKFPDMLPRPLLTGSHLIAMGLKPGISFSKILESSYNKQLDGWDLESIQKTIPKSI